MYEFFGGPVQHLTLPARLVSIICMCFLLAVCFRPHWFLSSPMAMGRRHQALEVDLPNPYVIPRPLPYLAKSSASPTRSPLRPWAPHIRFSS